MWLSAYLMLCWFESHVPERCQDMISLTNRKRLDSGADIMNNTLGSQMNFWLSLRYHKDIYLIFLPQNKTISVMIKMKSHNKMFHFFMITHYFLKIFNNSVILKTQTMANISWHIPWINNSQPYWNNTTFLFCNVFHIWNNLKVCISF